MKNKETEQYTFGTDEKEVLNKMAELGLSLKPSED